jgi:hypothetical protein
MSTQSQHRITFTLTDAALRDYYRYILTQTPNGRLGTVTGYLILLAFCLGLPSLLGPETRYDTLLAVICAVVGSFVYWWLIGLVIANAAKEAGKQISGTHTVELTPQGVYDSAEQYYTSWRWSAFRQITSTRRHIIMFIGTQTAAFVPRSAFPTPEASEAFLQLAKQFHEAAVPHQWPAR